MKPETLEGGAISYAPCRYGSSKIFFRGPRRSLERPYLTFVGGSQTYGKFIAKPFANLVEERERTACINLGCLNASVDAFLQEPAVGDICRQSRLNVLQVMSAHNMSNRFYTVHPRRNDRFVGESSVLRALYPEVDFSEFCFVRHLLSTLYTLSPERFEVLVVELRSAWRARMQHFIHCIGSHTYLLWFAEHLPTNANWNDRAEPLRSEPLFVTRQMVDELRPMVRGVVVVQPSQRAKAQGTRGMVFLGTDTAAATELLNPAAHDEAAQALSLAIRANLA